MSCTLHAPGAVAAAPAMTRCECAEVGFEEIARRVQSEGLTLEEVAQRTGCGGTCTACIPDLRRFLSARGAY